MRNLFYPVLFLVIVTVGCGHTNPDGRVDVSGKLTLNGEPITDGVWSIILKSADNHDDGGGGPVYGGVFLLTGRNAPKPGKYRVCLTGMRYIDGKTKGPVTAQTNQADIIMLKMLPNEFFTDSKIEFEVIAKKKNIFNYNIETNFKPEKITKH